jgi:hypothetical protein
MIVNVCPNVKNLSETLSSLNFSARARNSVLSLGNRDTIKKWRDVVSSYCFLTKGSDKVCPLLLSTCVFCRELLHSSSFDLMIYSTF